MKSLVTDVVECIQAVVGELLEQKLAGIGEAAPGAAAPTVAAVGTGAAVGSPSTSSSVGSVCVCLSLATMVLV